MMKVYRASGDIRQLGLSQAGSNEGNKGGRELHLDKNAGLNMYRG